MPSNGAVKSNYRVVSLFAGCGGMDLGFRGGFSSLGKRFSKRNFEIIWANDNFEDACLTYKLNLGNEIVCDDINRILWEPESQVFHKSLPSSADIVLGGFPCQDFSLAGKRRGFENKKRGQLYKAMVEVVRRTRPKIFVAENVKGLISAHNGEALSIITKDFAKLGYHVTWKLHLAVDYGVPQTRERVLIVGTDEAFLPPFVHPQGSFLKGEWTTLKQAIGDLEDVEEGGALNHFWSKAKHNKGQGNSLVHLDKPGPTMRAEHHGNIEFHWNGKRRLSAREAARIQTFPDDFEFIPSTSSAYKQIGNAVPPVLAWHMACTIQDFLDSHL